MISFRRSLLKLALPFALAAGHAFAQDADHAMMMKGAYGPYPMTREASGTAWVPDSSPHEGLHLHRGPWMFMLHGNIYGIYNHQGSDRGRVKIFSASMFMAQASRRFGPGTFGLRSMLSLDPTMGKSGYPLLLQTGETANGSTPLIDRQHPHDFFMELAATYSVPMEDKGSVFTYFGLPGEPAIGPPAFMHRLSGLDNPMAPISHHWLDSTHITYGVATVGATWDGWKLEGSSFKGREPNQHRWDIDSPKFDSFSGRLSWNPTRHWAWQASWGYIRSPEQLETNVNVHRVTSSLMHNLPLKNANWQNTVAWGQNSGHGEHKQNAYLAETALNWHTLNTVFLRFEHTEKDELFLPGDPLDHTQFKVSKVAWGYVRDFEIGHRFRFGLGGVGSADFLPAGLEPAYGTQTPLSFMLFARLKLS